jgi:hypothetical protein
METLAFVIVNCSYGEQTIHHSRISKYHDNITIFEEHVNSGMNNKPLTINVHLLFAKIPFCD